MTTDVSRETSAPAATPRAALTAHSFLEVGAIALQLAMLVVLIYEFDIESAAFARLSILMLVGFVVHAVLPMRWRLPFFLLLSVVGVALTLSTADAAWLIGVALLLIGICHLPWRYGVRVGLVVACALVLVGLRLVPGAAPWSGAVLPILASMFMFRMIIFLHDLRNSPELASPRWSLAYFLPLPNVCFPLFPVIDYRTFRKSYYDEEAFSIYQRGVRRMLRGLVHLLLYRLVYTYMASPEQVDSGASLFVYMLSTYLLYLRVSGQFHLIIGSLLLFGFNLPRTSQNYLLASSFTDFWRRINIYWKDFMMKIFYYPVYFRARKLGRTKALVISTSVVFLATWLLHSYQWFWLLGQPLISYQEVLFWGLLYVAVLVNVLAEAAQGEKRASASKWGVSRLLRIAATLVCICIVWSLWSSTSVTGWVEMLRTVGWSSVLILLLPIIFFVVSLLADQLGASWLTGAALPGSSVLGDRGSREGAAWRSVVATTAALVVLMFAGQYRVYSRLGPQVSVMFLSLKGLALNEQDETLLERGYYEHLTGQPHQNPELWEAYAKRPHDWVQIADTNAWRETNDLLLGELKPNQQLVFKGETLTTNRWGMRDKDYEKAKPDGTFRIALLGASHSMGSGVADDETFEALVEERLNSRADTAAGRVEILNFSVAGRFTLRQVKALEDHVLGFEPDVVVLMSHSREAVRTARDLQRVVRLGLPVPWEEVSEIARRAGIEAGMSETEAARLLKPYDEEVLSWVYRAVVERCEQNRVKPVLVYLPTVGRPEPEDLSRRNHELAREAGFEVISLAAVYEGQDYDELWIAEWDRHPNAAAHRLIADALYPELAKLDMSPDS